MSASYLSACEVVLAPNETNGKKFQYPRPRMWQVEDESCSQAKGDRSAIANERPYKRTPWDVNVLAGERVRPLNRSALS